MLTFLVAHSTIDTQALVITLVAPGARRTGLLGVTPGSCPARVTGAGEGGGAGAVTPLFPLATPLTAHGLTLDLLRLHLGPGPAFAAAGLTDHLGDILQLEDGHQLLLNHFLLEGVPPAEAEDAVLKLSVGHNSREARVDGHDKHLLFIADTITATKVHGGL